MVMTKQALYVKAIDLDPRCASAYYGLARTLPPESIIQLLDGTLMTWEDLSQMFRQSIATAYGPRALSMIPREV
jgi:hypothetical protein